MTATEEVRRSGRATKGQHTKNLDEPEVPAPKRAAKGGRSKAAKLAEATPPPEEDAIIRCICGYVVEDEDDERVMVICDQCEAWQHNECMEISEKSEELPEQYFCELCRPEDHKDLLAKVARGEKPWEERAKQRELEEEERKARRRKGKKGKKGRASEAKKEDKPEAVNGHATAVKEPIPEPQPELAAPPTPVAPPEVGQKRKLPSEEKMDAPIMDSQEPATKIRKISVPVPTDVKAAEVRSPGVKPTPPAQRRKSTAASIPPRRDSKEVVLQAELVENISDLHSEVRRKAATALVKLFVDQTKEAQKQGTFKVTPGQSLDAFGLKLGLAVEYALYLNFWGHLGEPNPQYKDKLRMMLHNVKANSALRDRLLAGSLSPNEFSKMSSLDMASKELQEKTAEMLKEAEKQHVLIQDDGPRIRRTHKGEEIVGGDDTQNLTSETTFSTMPSRRRDSEIDPNIPRHVSPGQMSPHSPNAVELPQDIAGSPTTAKPPAIDTATPRPPVIHKKSSSTFNIQNVWSSVDTPDVPKQPVRTLSQQQSSATLPAATPSQRVQADADIDHLLKDEEPDEEEPYSPTDYEADPITIWRGNMVMPGVADFGGSAKHVAGANVSGTYPWAQVIPSTLRIEGRIDIEKASSYLCGLRWSKSTDVSVIAITANNTIDDQLQFSKLFNYFSDRNRYGVVAKSAVLAVRDIYVVPIDSGTGKKPEFIELLEYCTIEEPRQNRSLLITYVIKSQIDTTPSAQATPRHMENNPMASPISAQTGHRHSLPMSASQMSPIGPYNGAGPQYGSPAQRQQPFAISQQSQPYPSVTGHLGLNNHNSELIGLDAARQVLGDMAESPSVAELLKHYPNTDTFQFGVIKDIFNNIPVSRSNFSMLLELLTARTQQMASAGS
ncbi:MAG: hypothetical protein MMC33_004164 [Icmadophila ericetorum]|nr:hypothetical protein [Icmadophila ericetorum]